MLVKLGIPVEIEGGADVLTDPVINQLLTLLKAINLSSQNLEDIDLFTLMHYPWSKLDPLAVLKLARQASKIKQSMVDLIFKRGGGRAIYRLFRPAYTLASN